MWRRRNAWEMERGLWVPLVAEEVYRPGLRAGVVVMMLLDLVFSH